MLGKSEMNPVCGSRKWARRAVAPKKPLGFLGTDVVAPIKEMFRQLGAIFCTRF